MLKRSPMISVRRATLNECINWYERGLVDWRQVKAYVKLWNDTPGRFTVAKLGVNNVYQITK